MDRSRILTVCSTTDYRNYTRRATIEAIRKLYPAVDILLLKGITSLFKRVATYGNADFYTHHTWIPESVTRIINIASAENFLRTIPGKSFFSRYDCIFFTDPNQHRLLPYLEEQKMVYLIRDPNVLQNTNHRNGEKKLLEKADLVLATSKKLAETYLPKYHKMDRSNIHYWPNCVDLDLWNFNKVNPHSGGKPVAGVAGNFGARRTDYELLNFITSAMPQIDFVIAGKIDRTAPPDFWSKLLAKKNVTCKGFIPYDDLPSEVARWDVGLVTERMGEYASYMHHNKIYQYLAMGIPVVSMKIHEDYENLAPCVHTAETKEEYSAAIESAVVRGKETKFQQICREKAVANSAMKRAKQFLDLLENIKH